MKVLVLNCGSSSIKYQLIDTINNYNLITKGVLERIGLGDVGQFTHQITGKEKYYKEMPIKNHEEGVKIILETLIDNDLGVIKNLTEIGACGHRIAHGGEYFSHSTILGEKELELIEKLCKVAPLHNPGSLVGIKAMIKALPNIKQIGVFDTSFHYTLPPKAYLYAIPYKYYEEDKIRRYGFHGTSHKFISEKACSILNVDIKTKKIITCHLGNGGSICAINKGISIDTSMGFTPVEGIVMGTRSGDLDIGALLYIGEKEKLDYKGMSDLVNKKSGLIGISGGYNDMRDINDGISKGNKHCENALEIYTYRIKKYIGAYTAAMNGVDIIVIAGGIGENQPIVREKILEDMDYLGIELNKDINKNSVREDIILSTDSSEVKILCVETDEELVIAKETFEIMNKS